MEGVEGCGKGTQTKLLSDFLSQKGEVLVKKYPDYGTPIGDLIDAWLHKNMEYSAEVQALLYFADFMKDKDLMEKYQESGKMVVADRYFTTGIVYQCLRGFPLEKMLSLAKLFELKVPDVCIYIRISPETSLARKTKEKGAANLDRHEEDTKFLSDAVNGFDKAAANNHFCEWITIDGEKSKEEVFEEIKEVLNKKFEI